MAAVPGDIYNVKAHRNYDCAVIGAGPAGLVSALYLARFKRKVIMFGHGTPRVTWAPCIHNLVGHDGGISGKKLLSKLQNQARKFEVKFVPSQARIKKNRNVFLIETEKRTFTAANVILATGVEDTQPQLSNLLTLRRRGFLRYCSICDGYEARNKKVYVVVKDDLGIKKAIFLSQWTKDIYILMISNHKVHPKRLKELKSLNINFIPCEKLAIKIKSPRLLSIQISGNESFECSLAYIELGVIPNDYAYKKITRLKKTKEGAIVTNCEQETSIKGVFAVGDCANSLSQVSVAAGQAAISATAVHNRLLKS